MKNPQICTVIWSSEQNVQLLLEILRQGTMVPITEATTIRAAITLMKYMFMVTTKQQQSSFHHYL